MAMHPEKFHQLSRALIREAEHDPMLDPMVRSILRDAPEDGEPVSDGGVDGHQIAGFHVRQNALAGRRERYEVSSNVPLDAQRKVEERVSTARTRPQPRKRRLQPRRLGGE